MSVKWANLKVELNGILVGVVLIILMGAMGDFFDTDPFFGMAIMLLSVIMVKVSYLVSTAQARARKSSEANKSSLAQDEG